MTIGTASGIISQPRGGQKSCFSRRWPRRTIKLLSHFRLVVASQSVAILLQWHAVRMV